MKPSEIVKTVRSRFPLLLYYGYPPGEDMEYDSEGREILFPNEIKLALRSYSGKTGIKEILRLKAEDLSPERTCPLPFAYLGLDVCHSRVGVYVRCLEDRRNGLWTFEPSLGWDDFQWPLTVGYYVDLNAYAADDLELPADCDFDLICDYLEALIGEVNAQHNTAMKGFDMEVELKTAPEYKEQRQRCLEEMKSLRSIPGVLSTGF